MDAELNPNLRETPLGLFDGKVDEKGRGKLPVEVRRYALGAVVEGEPDPVLFVTTLDGRTIKLYPIPAWREIEKKLETEREKAKATRQALDLAKHFGGKTTVDPSGRFMIPLQLRNLLELSGEGATVYYDCSLGYVTLRVKKYHEQAIKTALENAEANMEELASLGIR